MKSNTIIRRIVIEILVLLVTFNAVHMLSSPSETTAAAMLEAVNKHQLEPICLIEVRSAIHSASFTNFALFATQIALVILFFSDAWALWQSRRKV
jgi:hypothetical protein